MANSSKTKLDFEVRLTVLEQLMDRLMERVDKLAGAIINAEANSKELLQIVSKMQETQVDEWADDVVPQPPQPQKEEGKKENKKEDSIPDDVSLIYS